MTMKAASPHDRRCPCGDPARTTRLSVEERLAALERTRNRKVANVQQLETSLREHTRMGFDLRRELFAKFGEDSDHMDVVDTHF